MNGATITLASAIEALVCEKQAVGYKYCSEARVLERFEAFCASEFPGVRDADRSVRARRGLRPQGDGV